MEMRRIAPLFEGWEETMVWACLQGVMGRALASGNGRSAVIVQRDFCFFAGEPDGALVRRVEGPILVPRTEDWHPVIEEALGDQIGRAHV